MPGVIPEHPWVWASQEKKRRKKSKERPWQCWPQQGILESTPTPCWPLGHTLSCPLLVILSFSWLCPSQSPLRTGCLCVHRYWHRSLNPRKLIEVKFSHLSRNMTMQRTMKLYRLPEASGAFGGEGCESKGSLGSWETPQSSCLGQGWCWSCGYPSPIWVWLAGLGAPSEQGIICLSLRGRKYSLFSGCINLQVLKELMVSLSPQLCPVSPQLMFPEPRSLDPPQTGLTPQDVPPGHHATNRPLQGVPPRPTAESFYR